MPEVHLIGQLYGCSGIDGYDVFAKWHLETGVHISPSSTTSTNPTAAGSDVTGWRVLDGQSSGRTWQAKSNEEDGIAVWAEPIDVSYACNGIVGWPSLLLEVYCVDTYGRVDLAGYGSCRIPTSSGIHECEIVLARPRGTWWQYLATRFIGGAPRYITPSVLLSTASRFAHHTITTGTAYLRLNIIHRFFDSQCDHVIINDHVRSICHDTTWGESDVISRDSVGWDTTDVDHNPSAAVAKQRVDQQVAVLSPCDTCPPRRNADLFSEWKQHGLGDVIDDKED